MDKSIYELCVLVSSVGMAAILAIMFFGFGLWRARSSNTPPSDFWERLYFYFEKHGRPFTSLPRYATESYAEYLQRRNEFWTSYGQILLTIVLVIILSILLLTKTISAEAGLPILSAISGFAIAKGVSVGKSVGGPPDKPQE